jgi:uncharacterized protein YdbL (DUF1318 family)
MTNIKVSTVKTVTKSIVAKIGIAITALSITFSAWAVTLDQAKQQGLVGEMSNGYLGVVVANEEVKTLVAGVNKKRKDIYLKLARKNNITMKQVTALAGEKSIAKTQSGHFIKMPSGKWIKK